MLRLLVSNKTSTDIRASGITMIRALIYKIVGYPLVGKLRQFNHVHNVTIESPKVRANLDFGLQFKQAVRCLVLAWTFLFSVGAFADAPFAEYAGAWDRTGHWTSDINAAGAEGVALRNALCPAYGCGGDTCTFTVVSLPYALGNCLGSGQGVAVAVVYQRQSCPAGSSIIGSICVLGGPKNSGDPGCQREGNPIHAGTGNKYQEEVDHLGVAGFPQGVSHFSNSQVAHSFGWAFNWDAHGVAPSGAPPDVATVTRVGNQEYQFFAQGNDWKSDADVTARLIRLFDANSKTTGWLYVAPNDDVEAYSAGNQIQSITNRQGWKWTYTWVGSNYTVTDPFGRQLIFGADVQNNRVVTTPDGRVLTYRSDAIGNLTSVTYPDGKIRSYVYEDSRFPNALTGVIDENGNRYATWTYEAQGRAISSEHAGGAERTGLVYDAGSTAVTDASGAQRTRNMSTILGVVKSTGSSQPGGSGCAAAASAMSYDPNGNVASRTDFNGAVTTYSYDLGRNLETQRIEAANGASPRTISTRWHSFWRQPIQVAEPQKLTSYIFNGDTYNGNVVSCAPATALIALGSTTQPIGVLCKKIEQATDDLTGCTKSRATG